MLKEVTKEEAVAAAMNGQNAYMMSGDDSKYITDLKKALDKLFNESNPRFLADVPEEKPAATTSFGQKTGRPKGRPKIDVGKIKALHNAGWSQAKIADEMGLAQSTVYRYLHQEGEENDS